jgi:hypothetical protein
MKSHQPNAWSSPEVVRATGVTYRQLAYWVATGRLVPTIEKGRGSGHRHQWTADDVSRITMVKLVLDDGESLDAAFRHVDRIWSWLGEPAIRDRLVRPSAREVQP